MNRVLVGYNRVTDGIRILGRGDDSDLFKIKPVVAECVEDELSIMSVPDGLQLEELVGNQKRLLEVFGSIRDVVVTDNIELAEEEEF